MGRIITSPDGMTFSAWLNQVSIELKALLPQVNPIINQNDQDAAWRDCVYILLQDKRFKNVPIPDKIVYPASDTKSWQKWAFDWIASGQNT